MIFKELCPTQSRHTRSLSQPLADARQAVNLKPIALTRTEPDMHPYLPNVGTMQPLAGYCSSRLPPSSSVLGRDPSQLLRCADCQASGLLEHIAIFYQLGSSGLFLQRASSNSKAQVGLLLLVQGLFDPVAGVECLGLAAIWAAVMAERSPGVLSAAKVWCCDKHFAFDYRLAPVMGKEAHIL